MLPVGKHRVLAARKARTFAFSVRRRLPCSASNDDTPRAVGGCDAHSECARAAERKQGTSEALLNAPLAIRSRHMRCAAFAVIPALGTSGGPTLLGGPEEGGRTAPKIEGGGPPKIWRVSASRSSDLNEHRCRWQGVTPRAEKVRSRPGPEHNQAGSGARNRCLCRSDPCQGSSGQGWG